MKTIHLDMDGVVADWDAGVEALIGQRRKLPEDDPDPTWGYEHWDRIRSHIRMYRDLPLVANCEQLVDAARQLRDTGQWDLVFLTAVPRKNDVHWAFWDKFTWCQRHFPDIPVHFGPFSDTKWQHCQPGDILIDDRRSNIDKWNEVGGKGFYVRSGEIMPAVDFLKGLL